MANRKTRVYGRFFLQMLVWNKNWNTESITKYVLTNPETNNSLNLRTCSPFNDGNDLEMRKALFMIFFFWTKKSVHINDWLSSTNSNISIFNNQFLFKVNSSYYLFRLMYCFSPINLFGRTKKNATLKILLNLCNALSSHVCMYVQVNIKETPHKKRRLLHSIRCTSIFFFLFLIFKINCSEPMEKKELRALFCHKPTRRGNKLLWNSEWTFCIRWLNVLQINLRKIKTYLRYKTRRTC